MSLRGAFSPLNDQLDSLLLLGDHYVSSRGREHRAGIGAPDASWTF